MNWKELECTGRQCNHEMSETHYIVFDRDIKHSQQQLLESLEEEVKKLETKEYLAGSPEYHRQRVLNKVKALIQSKKEL